MLKYFRTSAHDFRDIATPPYRDVAKGEMLPSDARYLQAVQPRTKIYDKLTRNAYAFTTA